MESGLEGYRNHTVSDIGGRGHIFSDFSDAEVFTQQEHLTFVLHSTVMLKY